MIAVWFSCGAASAVAAAKTLEIYQDDVVIVNNPIREEHEDNKRFLHDVEEWLGVKIQTAINDRWPNGSCTEVWEHRKIMSTIHGAPCTLELKKHARRQYEEANDIDYHVLGFTVDEQKRADRMRMTELPELLTPLITLDITKSMCFSILKEARITLPWNYRNGLYNANCLGCVKATSPTYWNHIRQIAPDVFCARARQSRKLGAKLVRVKGERIYLDELSPLAKGRPQKSLPSAECGIFCEPNA